MLEFANLVLLCDSHVERRCLPILRECPARSPFARDRARSDSVTKRSLSVTSAALSPPSAVRGAGARGQEPRLDVCGEASESTASQLGEGEAGVPVETLRQGMR